LLSTCVEAIVFPLRPRTATRATSSAANPARVTTDVDPSAAALTPEKSATGSLAEGKEPITPPWQASASSLGVVDDPKPIAKQYFPAVFFAA
jgi:hypothetical protein